MANEPAKPTEEQIKAANEAEESRWQGDFKEEDLKIPYKREVEDTKDANKDTEAAGRPGDNDPPKDTEQAEEEPQEQYTDPAPVVTVNDPGEYKPADVSFEVTLKDGKTVKVTTPEEADKLADDPENFETPKQLLDFIKKSTQMQNKLDADYNAWANQKKTFTEQLATETERRESVETFVGEFNYLVGKGLLPAVAKEYVDADWNDPEVAKQPGVKEQIALLNYMVEENKVRAKAKVKLLDSIVDTYNAWKQDPEQQKADAKRKAEEEAAKAAGEARKAAGARVASVSPAQQGTYVPKGIAVGNPNVLKRGAAVWDD